MVSSKMKVITCILCEEPYGPGKHEPVALPACGHTFCRWCLMQMSLENAVLRCPTCRTVHDGPPPEDLAKNFALLSCIGDLADQTIGDQGDHKMKKSPLDTSEKHEKSELKGLKRESSKESFKKEKDGKGNSSDSPSSGWKKLGYGACIATGAIGAVAAAPVVLAGVGFTATGITAGSWAASMMSASAIANGGGVVAGGLVATLQSAGAAGIGAAATGAVATVGGAVGGGVAALSHKLFG